MRGESAWGNKDGANRPSLTYLLSQLKINKKKIRGIFFLSPHFSMKNEESGKK